MIIPVKHLQIKYKYKWFTSFSSPLSLASDSSPPESSVGEPPSSLSTTKSSSYKKSPCLNTLMKKWTKGRAQANWGFVLFHEKKKKKAYQNTRGQARGRNTSRQAQQDARAQKQEITTQEETHKHNI